jgi:membrane protein YdbS with pleckstrin-like domain
MPWWWWVLVGLAAWFVVAVAVALVIGPWLARGSQARDKTEEHGGPGS